MSADVLDDGWEPALEVIRQMREAEPEPERICRGPFFIPPASAYELAALQMQRQFDAERYAQAMKYRLEYEAISAASQLPRMEPRRR